MQNINIFFVHGNTAKYNMRLNVGSYFQNDHLLTRNYTHRADVDMHDLYTNKIF